MSVRYALILLIKILALTISAHGHLFPELWEVPRKELMKRDQTFQSSNDKVSTTTLPFCDENKLMENLADIQAITPESIINLASKHHCDLLCNKVSDHLDAIDELLKTCRPEEQADLYMQLIKGVNSLYDMLCKPGNFSKAFAAHRQCIRQLHADYEDCSGPSDWTEDMEQDQICRAYNDIIECYYQKTAHICGREAAEVMRNLSKAVVSSVLTQDCHNVHEDIKNQTYYKDLKVAESKHLDKSVLSKAGNPYLDKIIFSIVPVILKWFT